MRITQQDAQNIVNEMKASIHRDVNIMDREGVIVASTNPARRGHLHAGALRVIREGLPSLAIWRDDPAAGIQQGVNLPVALAGELEGVIGVTGDPAEVSMFGDVIKRMTEIMLESLHQREQLDLLDRAKGLFVENWLFAPEPDWGELELRGRLLGLRMDAPYAVALLRAEERAGDRTEELDEVRSNLLLRMVRSRLPDGRDHFCAVIRNRILVLLWGMGRREAVAAADGLCRDMEGYYGLRVTAGVSAGTEGPSGIRRCYREAQAAQAVAAQGSRSQAVFYDHKSLEFIVRSIPAAIKRDLGEAVFGGCSEEERREFSELIRLYFREGGDISRCARRLFIHRNTFQYRMDRLEKRTGCKLRDPRSSLLLYLAAREDGEE